MEQTLVGSGQPGRSVLQLPDGPVRAGLVVLHGASDGRARQPLFDQLGGILSPVGVAVLSYERRQVGDQQDTPLETQAHDAAAAARALKAELGCPVGVFGFSQGAWAATLAAADPIIEFLIVLGCSGVSPAAQMRYQLLKRHGYTKQDRDDLLRLRMMVEDYLRTPDPDDSRRGRASAQLRAASTMPWFEHAYLPDEPPSGEAKWSDMDFDPAPTFTHVHVPVLAMWGSDEECVPRIASQRLWRTSGADVTVVDLPGCGHWPAIGSGEPGYSGWDTDPLSRDFATALTSWLPQQLPGTSTAAPGAHLQPAQGPVRL